MSLTALQITHHFTARHDASGDGNHSLYSMYELVCDDVQRFRVRIHQSWGLRHSSVEAWNEETMLWHQLAVVRQNEPEWRETAKYDLRLHPPTPEPDHHHNKERDEESRIIALEVERETLKRACWVLFGVNEMPQITTLTEQ